MPAVPPLITMIWNAMPPELNTFRLQAGAGEAPMAQAAMGWEALAVALTAQAAELAASLSALTGTWTGIASETAVTSTMRMVLWLEMVAMQAQKRALQAAAQASSYAAAYASTPQLEEIAQNHITHAVLEATNFLGCNIPPIGVNEMDYARMWALAASVMDGYQAETMVNVLFEPIAQMTPIVMPGVAEAAMGAAMAQTAAAVPGALARDFALAHVSLQSTLESAMLAVNSFIPDAAMAAENAQADAARARNTESGIQQQTEQATERGTQQGMQQGMQMASQMGSQLASLPQQLGQMVQSPMQQLTQPLQQATQMMGQLAGNHSASQSGLLGTSPLSNHPLVGGSGASTGAGLVRAASLPGAGGSAPRTALLASLVETSTPPASGAGKPAVVAGAAPVGGGGGGGGGGAPVHAGSQKSKQTTENKEALHTPSVLLQDLGEDDADDW